MKPTMRVLLHKFTTGERSANDNDLHIHIALPWVRRGNCLFRASPLERKLLIMLAANMGRFVSTEEITDALYGDDPDGGPEDAPNAIRVRLAVLRAAAPGLGFKIKSNKGWGYRLELLDNKKGAA